ncbi:MAG: urease accessory protein UreH domain-containing protein, partial [Promethearchaeota archaeon]
MLAQIPLDSAGFFLILWTGLMLGFLHSIMPCEDKAILIFFAFGVARDRKQAFRIVNYYGFGLFLMNLIIGTIITYFGALLGYNVNINRNILTGIAAIALIISGIVMLFRLKKQAYWPHSDQLQEITEGLSTLRSRKRTAFLLGMLAGIPPCIFEMAVYISGVSFAVSYGWGNGVWTIFFFGIGTWIGLYPLALVGTVHGKLSKMLRSSSVQKMQDRLRFKRKETSSPAADAIPSEISESSEPSDIAEKKPVSTVSRIEKLSAYSLIMFGIVFLILAILQIDIIPEPYIPT